MTKHKLYLDLECELDFKLISIISSVRDYRLCWFANKMLSLNFERTEELEIHLPKKKKMAYFNLFHAADEENWMDYYFISNKSLGENLIPELKQVDYFLMLKGAGVDEEIPRVLEEMKKLRPVEIIFETNPETLKSKENLIFE